VIDLEFLHFYFEGKVGGFFEKIFEFFKILGARKSRGKFRATIFENLPISVIISLGKVR
jgi:hypothetical protein